MAIPRFDEVAVSYASARPSYPALVFETIAERFAPGPGSRILEVGCGTGQATRDLCARFPGAHVTAIDIGPNLIACAREALAGAPLLTFVQSSFEDFDPIDPFDLTFSAGALHWIQPEVAIERLAESTTPGGGVALVWHHQHHEDQDPRCTEGLDRLYDELADTEGRPRAPYSPLSHKTPIYRDLLDADPRFEDVRALEHVWSAEYDAERLTTLFSTYSPQLAMTAPQRRRFLDGLAQLVHNLGGAVRRTYRTTLYTARRT